MSWSAATLLPRALRLTFPCFANRVGGALSGRCRSRKKFHLPINGPGTCEMSVSFLTERLETRTQCEPKCKEPCSAREIVGNAVIVALWRLDLYGNKVSGRHTLRTEITHEALRELRDDIAEGVECAVGEGKGCVGVRLKGLLVCARKSEAGHDCMVNEWVCDVR